MQIARAGLVIGPAQFILHDARPIDDPRQPAGHYIERHPNRRNQKNRRQGDLNEVRNIGGLWEKRIHHFTTPKYQVPRITNPKAIRYQANTLKLWPLT